MSSASDLERQMLDLINEERTSRGLNPVDLELRLNESSEDHSQWMLEQDQFSHTGAGGSSAGDRMRDADFDFEGRWTWGENIAYQSERGAPGLEDDVEDLHTALMNSPGHRANILNPDYEVVGLGIETGDFEGFDAVMVTQNFAATDAELELDQQSATSPDPVSEAPDPTAEPVAEAPDEEEETPDPLPGPDPEAETPDPEPEQPTAEAPEPDTENPETEEPVAEAPEPDVEEPQPDPVAEAPDPEPETPDMGGTPEDVDDPEPVAEAPDEEPDTPMPDPTSEDETPEMEPETPEVVADDPEQNNGVGQLAQLQFFVTGFIAALLDEDFTFTFDGGEERDAQTVSFDLDDFFASILDTPDGGDGSEPDADDMVLASDDTADSDFQFTDHWDCLA